MNGIRRNPGLAIIAVLTVLSWPVPGLAQQQTNEFGSTQITDCDRLAGLKSDPDRIGDGVTPEELAANSRAALTACGEALKAAEGTRRFMTGLGLAYFYQDQPRDAMQWFLQAAELGSSTAMNGIGVLYAQGKGVPADHGKALNWFRKSADLGNARAMVNLGISYSKRGPDKDMEQAMAWFRKAAEKGDRDGSLHVGMVYYGVGNFGDDDDWQKTDGKEALKWLSRAADMGSAEAMNYIGQMYLYGHGIEKSDANAMMWFRKAVDAGYDDATSWLETLCGWSKNLSQCEEG